MFFDTRLWQFTRGVRLRIAGTVAMGVFASLVGIGRLALLGWLLARVFAGDTLSELMVPFALVAAVMVLRGWLEHTRAMVAHRTAAMVQLELRKRLYARVVALGPSYFGLERTGAVMISMIDGVEQLETYFGEYLPQLLVSFITPIVVFALLAFLDLPVAALMFAFAMFTLFAPASFQRWDSRSSMRRSKAYRGFAAEFLDAVQGLATLKAFGQSTARGRLLAERAHEVFRSTMWVLATNSLTRGLTDTGIAVGSAAVLAFGAWRVVDGQMGLDVLLIVLMMGIEVFRPQRDLRALLHNGMMGRAAADDIFTVLNARPRVEPPAAPVELDGPLAPVVEFDDVSFAYPGGRRTAHRNLAFRVEPGERVGFVGESGAGKSTIVRLLLRFYDPDEGAVRIGGHDLRALRPDDVYRNVAVVNQDTYLFHGTVEENLRFGKPDATGEEIEAAARAANAHEFISRLPQGYASVIGERGIRLSGGQRQRIAIARALLRDAPILILDEALSAVDAENEAVIQSALDRLMQGRTTLIFAHRLSSVIGADRILVLDHGSIVETGDHASLMRAGGAYLRLMGAQAEESAQSEEGAQAGASLAAPAAGHAQHREVPLEDLQADDASAHHEPTDAILRAEGLSWAGAFRELLRHVVPWKVKFSVVLVFGIVRVAALIGVGVASALAVAAVKQGEPFTQYLVVLAIIAPLAGVLHWLESWFAHDMAFRMLAEMRIALYEKLDRLAPAYLVRRRTGDLVGMATHDVELVEYFFAHTVAPFFVAVLVPGVVIGTLAWFGWPMALALIPFLALVALSPFLARHRIDTLGSRAREAFGDMNAHAVDTIQGLAEIVAFQRTRTRAAEFVQDALASARYRSAGPPKLTQRLDALFLHRIAGPAVFLVLAALVFQAIFTWATPIMDGVELGIASSGEWVAARLPAGWFRDLLIDGVWAGVGSVLVFLPQILILFLFLGILEDFRIHGAGCGDRGPDDAARRSSGAGVPAAAVGVRVRGSGDPLVAHGGGRARPPGDHVHRPVHDLLRAAAGVCASHRRVHSRTRAPGSVPGHAGGHDARPVRARSPRRGRNRLPAAAHRAPRQARRVCDGAAAVPHPVAAHARAPFGGPERDLPPPGGQDHPRGDRRPLGSGAVPPHRCGPAARRGECARADGAGDRARDRTAGVRLEDRRGSRGVARRARSHRRYAGHDLRHRGRRRELARTEGRAAAGLGFRRRRGPARLLRVRASVHVHRGDDAAGDGGLEVAAGPVRLHARARVRGGAGREPAALTPVPRRGRDRLSAVSPPCAPTPPTAQNEYSSAAADGSEPLRKKSG